MKWVYVLKSLKAPEKFYIGLTGNLELRLKDHNAGKSRYSSKFAPWKVSVSICFEEDEKARAFENYLKSGSGHAFAKKHFE